MKRIFLSVMLVFASLSTIMFASDAYDISRLSITVCQPDYKLIPLEVKNILESKMQQILTSNGVIDNNMCNRRFVMTSKINILSKDIIAGLPQKVSQRLEVTFLIGDVIENKIYNSVALNVIGVDVSETKSFIRAVNTIKPTNPVLQDFILQSKMRIVDYYKQNASIIIEKADAKVHQGKMREALYDLAQVPDVCWEEYVKCQNRMISIYSQIVDADGKRLLLEAKAIWASAPNSNSSKEVASLLSKIDNNASCQPEVKEFMDEVKAKLVEDEKREWEFMMQKYNDEKVREQRDFEYKRKQYEDAMIRADREYADNKIREERDFQFEKEKYNAEIELQKQGISAARDVAMEFAKSLASDNNAEMENRVIYWN